MVYARWVGAEHLPEKPRNHSPQMHHYVIPIKPMKPLQVGKEVRVMALSRVAFHTPNVVSPRYEVYDPHVRGKVAAVVGAGKGSITFELENECDINPITKVRLMVRWDPNITAVAPHDPPPPEDIRQGPTPQFETNIEIGIPGPDGRCLAARCRGPSNPDDERWAGIICIT